MTAEINLDTHFSVPPQVMSRLVGEETVLLDIANGVYFGLDGVGKRIWENIADGLSLQETAKVITTEFEVGDTRAQEDVVAFARNLVDRELLRTL